MNSESSKTSDAHRLWFNPAEKVDLWRDDNSWMALPNVRICYTWKSIKQSYKNNKIKISDRTWDKEFELPDGSYFISDILDYIGILSRGMKHCLINHHSKYISTKFITVLHSELNLGTVSRSWHLRLWNYLWVPKKK